MRSFALLLILTLTPAAQALRLDVRYRVWIQEACLQRVHGAQALKFCSCVGTRHYRSAAQMPDVPQAKRDIVWVLAYYRARTPRRLRELRADPNNLVAYDAFIGHACRTR